ncbi:QRFP-like peptide receptor [Actinia tenebrosa]|uniref:QRFP-like peptide receptor n=1 Tax=Actinia tenebrosa TaxID=6105 RepID=A0A6P8I2Q8_ACTTE|nr:QRFP-like peptide receptor [Actinia tenebrosa]
MDQNTIVEVKDYERNVDVYFKVLFSIDCALIVFGILANCVVLLVLFTSNKQHKSLSTFLIMYLSASDLVLRVVGLYTVVIRARKWTPLFHCKCLTFIQYTCCACVFTLLSGIAVDRYVHIIHPLKSLYFKPRKAVVIGSILVYSAAVSVSFLVSAETRDVRRRFWFQPHGPNSTRRAVEKFIPYPGESFSNSSNISMTTFDVNPERKTCVALGIGTLDGQVSITTYFTLVFVAPLFIMGYSYARIFFFLSKKARRTKISSHFARSRMKAVKMLIIVVLSFLCSWGPILVFDLLHAYNLTEEDFIHSFPRRPVLESLCYTSSIMNPVIYAFNDSSFRKSVKNIIQNFHVK